MCAAQRRDALRDRGENSGQVDHVRSRCGAARRERRYHARAFDAPRAAALLGLEQSDLDPRYPSQFANVGPWFVLIGAKTHDALRRITVDPTVYEDVAAGGWVAVFTFPEEPYNDDASVAARMLIPFNGLREDPTTGSANTAFARYPFSSVGWTAKWGAATLRGAAVVTRKAQ